MWKPILRGLAAASLIAIAWPAAQALDISRGCTDPPHIEFTTIKIYKFSDTATPVATVSGGFCAAIERAVAIVAHSSMSRREKNAVNRALSDLEARDLSASGSSPQFACVVRCEQLNNKYPEHMN